jgi:hypothetical protein
VTSLPTTERPGVAVTRRPHVNRNKVLARVLEDPDTYATTLLVVVLDRLGTEALEWHPETLQMEIREQFGVDLSKNAKDRLMAAIAVVTTNYFWRDVRRFIELCNIFAGDDFDPTVFNPADSAEMAWGVAEASLLSPPEESQPFHPDVQQYVGKMLAEEGYVRAPNVLSFALADDVSGQISDAYADDPEMFGAIWKHQESKSQELDFLVQENLQELFQQLSGLPLQEGSTDNLLQRLREGSK